MVSDAKKFCQLVFCTPSDVYRRRLIFLHSWEVTKTVTSSTVFLTWLSGQGFSSCPSRWLPELRKVKESTLGSALNLRQWPNLCNHRQSSCQLFSLHCLPGRLEIGAGAQVSDVPHQVTSCRLALWVHSQFPTDRPHHLRQLRVTCRIQLLQNHGKITYTEVQILKGIVIFGAKPAFFPRLHFADYFSGFPSPDFPCCAG